MPRILVIEDEELLRLSIAETLTKAGHTVVEADNLGAAATAAREGEFDLVLTDVLLGGENGIDFVRSLREQHFEGVVVVMTAHATVELAVTALRVGADDFLQKPLVLRELSRQVGRWLELRRVKRRLELYERLEKVSQPAGELLGNSPAWQGTLNIARRLAGVPLPDSTHVKRAGLPTILLLGETGSGKGVLARYIHDTALAAAAGAGSAETDGGPSAPGSGAVVTTVTTPFVHVNCASLPPTLVESELFGHEKGAFTDARESRSGLFEMADGGTIFLDEIGEMPPELQAKLLLVLERGVFRRVGGSKERYVRARVIAATNQDLEARTAAGTFRRDLFYRLATFTVRIPPLRERGGDALLIAEALLPAFARQYARPSPSLAGAGGAPARVRLSPAARARICAHDWPGNVRELINAVQRAVMLSDSHELGAADLGLPVAAESTAVEHSDPLQMGALEGDPFDAIGLGQAAGGDDVAVAEDGLPTFDFARHRYTVDAVERSLLKQALEHTRGNVTRAARLLDMQRSSLRYRIDRLGLQSLVVELAER